ncbi:unnamed protein product [Linum tenue]|uniref:Uncharacterized protein n=1 Tax=Linum tenue TaxID=586396 RepID=A0AAV0QWC7_9ROSI|nr:unnamed protein product [Linum tenue]
MVTARASIDVAEGMKEMGTIGDGDRSFPAEMAMRQREQKKFYSNKIHP